MKRRLFAGIFIATFFACKPQPPTQQQLVSNFAQLECRAIALRQQRFALANAIRFAEDSLSRARRLPDSARYMGQLQTMLTQKQQLANQSIALADTIKKQLDTLMQVQLTDALQRKKFTDQLAKQLRQMGCSDQP